MMPDHDFPLTADEKMLIGWLGRERFSRYCDCQGVALDGLIAKGLAKVEVSMKIDGWQPMYRAVSLTAAGRGLLVVWGS